MIIELYTAPEPAQGVIESPVSNIRGELPEQEPTLDSENLLGSFDSREEAIDFIGNQAAGQNQTVTDSQSAPFNEYTHIEWLTVTVKTADQSTRRAHYYLVTDEGY